MAKPDGAFVDRFLESAGVKFDNWVLLQQALTHSSYVYENAGGAARDNEGLEFLGDAVLGLVVVEHFFHLTQQQNLDVGFVARLKSWVVSEEVLADCAENLGLPLCLLLGRGEHSSGGRRRSGLLADALEAVIGAYYLDQGARAAQALVLRLLGPYIDRSLKGGYCSDYKSLLQIYVQREFKQLPCYRVVGVEGAEHQQNFVVEVSFGEQCRGRGSGANKKRAEKDAARDVCQKLGLDHARA